MQQKTAGIVVIGNEILTGKSAEKNATYLIGELHQLGVALRRIVFIPDDVEDIGRTVSEFASTYDYVFTSGGVGPTHDDVTISGIARAFGRAAVRHPQLERMLRDYFGNSIDDSKLRLAETPEGAELINEGEGHWPVLAVENVYVLPGVPELFRRKFEAIRERFRAEPFFVRTIYTKEDELDIASRLDRVAADHPRVEIGSYPTFKEADYRVKVTIESKDAAQVDRAFAALMGLLDPNHIANTE
jgi:molybdenum cofactor synthesis domain-containing protein